VLVELLDLMSLRPGDALLSLPRILVCSSFPRRSRLIVSRAIYLSFLQILFLDLLYLRLFFVRRQSEPLSPLELTFLLFGFVEQFLNRSTPTGFVLREGDGRGGCGGGKGR
jgi:hypothetical protein